MKKTYIIAALVAGVTAASAQNYVAGWDFQSVAGTDVLANGYNSDRNIGTADAVITSSDFDFISNNGAGNTVIAGTSFWQANGFDGGNGSSNTAGTSSIFISNSGALEIAFNATNSTNTAFSIMWDVAVTGDYGTAFPSGFGPTFYSDPFTVELYNGNTQIVADLLSAVDTPFASDFDTQQAQIDISALDGIANARILLTANNNVSGAGRNLTLDNIAISGTGSISVVPEPSAFALIAGALVLGFISVRRRRA